MRFLLFEMNMDPMDSPRSLSAEPIRRQGGPYPAILLGLVTELVAASFVVIDACIGIASAHDAASLQNAPRAFYFLAQWAHWPAVIVLSVLDALLEAVLGLSRGKPAFFAGFGASSPNWVLICLAQAILWTGFWAALFALGRQIRQIREARLAPEPCPPN